VPEKRYPDAAYYDFERNYTAALELTRRVFGDARADALQAAKGKSKRTDFMTAMTWGWWLHRPVLDRTDRVICILGALAPKALEQGLRDYLQLGLAIGLHREKLREAMFILSVYGGVPRAEWALGVVDSLCAELDAAGWQPFTPPGPLYEAIDRDYYDFEHNFPSGIEMSIRLFGDRGGSREERLARQGESAIGDFQAVHWGWLNQRPYLSPRERSLFLIGLDAAVLGHLALKDHVQWALDAGVNREQIMEAMTMLYMYNGWPANREALVTVTEWLAELERR
jgi:alkylhydroperoxidase/carboxymuconolactone decarboxylase family protein YurZ